VGRGRADSDFQGRTLFVKTDIPTSTEEIDQLLPSAPTPSPDLSPRQHCCVFSRMQSPASSRQGLGSSQAAQPGGPSSQTPLDSLAFLPAPRSPGARVTSISLAGTEQATSGLAPSSTPAQNPRAAGTGTRDAKCNRGSEGIAQVPRLGSGPGRTSQRG